MPNAVEQPHYAAVGRGVVVLTTGGTRNQAKTFVLRGEAAPTVLGPPEEARRPVQYTVSSRHVIKAEIAEGDQSAKVQLKLLRADKPVG